MIEDMLLFPDAPVQKQSGHDTTFVVNGASNHSQNKRQLNDYYATSPVATRALLDYWTFSKDVYEPFVGGGHIAEALKGRGYNVRCSDIVDRGYPGTEIIDFLHTRDTEINADIVSNPPYKYAARCWKKACSLITKGHFVAYLLKLTFLEGQERRVVFRRYPPCKILVFSKRVSCAKNGDFEKYPGGAIAYAWFIYSYGFTGLPVIDWL